MKFTLIILTVLAPFFAHAGGGGGLRPGMQTMMMSNAELSNFGGTGGGGVLNQPEIFFHMGESNGVVLFAHGQLVNKNQWQIQKIQLPLADLVLAPEEVTALEKSKVTKDWVIAK